MTRRGWIAIALVVWTIVVALRGVSVSALPNHVVAGGVFGVGGNVSQGPANPANAAGLVFYSTNQVGYTPLTGTDSYTPADGTNPQSATSTTLTPSSTFAMAGETRSARGKASRRRD